MTSEGDGPITSKTSGPVVGAQAKGCSRDSHTHPESSPPSIKKTQAGNSGLILFDQRDLSEEVNLI